MRTCPECRSLVSVPLDSCPARREACPLLEADADAAAAAAAAASAGAEDPTEAVTEPELDLADLDPHRTARIEQGEIQAALARSGLSLDGSSAETSPDRRSELHRRAGGAPPRPLGSATGSSSRLPRNHAALLAHRLAAWSVVPLFPIGLTAAVLAMIGLHRGSRDPSLSGTDKAWAGLFAGLLLGSIWLAITVWIVLELS